MKSRLLIALLLIAGIGAAQELPRYDRLQYPPLGQVKIPDIAHVTLPNGMQLFLLENHQLPLISGTAVVRTGNLFDPPDKIGLAEFTGEVMRSGGTADKTGDEIDVELEDIAASVESSIGETSGSVSFNTLAENVDEVLGVFHDVLTAPEFRQDKLDLLKTQMHSVIARRNDSAPGIAGREFVETLYGRDTPYGWRMEHADVDNITRDDLIAMHRRYFFPANIMLAVQGDFDAADMQAKLAALFADWTVKQEPVPAFPPVTAGPTHNVQLAVKNDVNQTMIHIGHLGGELRDPDYPALEVMADILGGGFDSRLFKKVRTELGWAYSVSASWGANYNHPGVFSMTAATKSETTTETIEAILKEVDRMRTEEVTDDELQGAKDKVLNSFVFAFDQPSKTLSRLVNYTYQGYPQDFIFQYQQAIGKVTKADVLRVASEHIKPDDLSFVVVGKPGDFGKPLSDLGLPVVNVDLTIPQPPAAEATPEGLEQGAALLGRVQEAVGGADRLASIKDYKRTSTVSLQGGAMSGEQVMSWIRPNIFRQDQHLPMGTISVFYDGESGWMSTPQGTAAVPPPLVAQIASGMFRFLPTLLLSDRNPQRQVNLVAPGSVEISEGDQRTRLVVDEATSLPSRMVYSQSGQEVQELLSDWRDVDGYRMPFHVVTQIRGQVVSDLTVSEALIDSGLDAAILSQQP